MIRWPFGGHHWHCQPDLPLLQTGQDSADNPESEQDRGWLSHQSPCFFLWGTDLEQICGRLTCWTMFSVGWCWYMLIICWLYYMLIICWLYVDYMLIGEFVHPILRVQNIWEYIEMLRIERPTHPQVMDVRVLSYKHNEMALRKILATWNLDM